MLEGCEDGLKRFEKYLIWFEKGKNSLKMVWKVFKNGLKIVWKTLEKFEKCLKMVWKAFEKDLKRVWKGFEIRLKKVWKWFEKRLKKFEKGCFRENFEVSKITLDIYKSRFQLQNLHNTFEKHIFSDVSFFQEFNFLFKIMILSIFVENFCSL